MVYELLLTINIGLEKILIDYLKKKYFFYEIYTKYPGKIYAKTDKINFFKIVLNDMAANRIFLKLGEFRAKKFAEFERKVKKMKNLFIDYSVFSQNLKLKIETKKCLLYHTNALKERILKNLYRKSSKQFLYVIGYKDNFEFYLSINLDDRSKRGYKQLVATAPIKENIAYLLVNLLAKNIKICDLFCGTGTFLTEYINYFFNINFWNYRDDFSIYDWKILQGENVDKYKESLNIERLEIVANDINNKMLKITKKNLNNILSKFKLNEFVDVKFFNNDFLDLNLNALRSFNFISNLPFGKRIKVSNLYKILEKLKSNIKIFEEILILSTNKNLKDLELITKFFNGGLKINIFAKLKEESN